MLEKIKKQKLFVIWIIVCFIGMCIFYIRMHPLVMQSPDDWTYISYSRQAWPMKGAWNPGKVFPETVGGLIGNLCGFVLYPLIVADYVKAFSVGYGIAYAAMVTFYMYCFGRLIQLCLKLDDIQTSATLFIFFVSHFQITKVSLNNNNYLFNTNGINIGMNYFMPMIICASLAFYLMKRIVNDDYFVWHRNAESVNIRSEFKSIKNGVIFLALYLSVFSNLCINGTLIALIGAAFLFRIYNDFHDKKKRSIKEFLSDYAMYFTVFVMDLLCAIAEMLGGNAGIFEGVSLKQSIKAYPSTVMSMLAGVNKVYLFIGAIIIVIALDLSVSKNADTKSAKKFQTMILLSIMALIIDFIYVSVISIRVGGYLEHTSVYNGILLWVVIPVSISFSYILKRVEELRAFIPIVVFVTFFVMINVPDNIGNGFGLGDRMYGSRESGQFYYEEDSSLVEQFIEADKSGVSEFTLYSKGQVGEYGQWAAYRVRRTLLRHGVINRFFEVNVEKE